MNDKSLLHECPQWLLVALWGHAFYKENLTSEIIVVLCLSSGALIFFSPVTAETASARSLSCASSENIVWRSGLEMQDYLNKLKLANIKTSG